MPDAIIDTVQHATSNTTMQGQMLREIELAAQDTAIAIPSQEQKTLGDWSRTINGTEYRSTDALDYTVIDEMLKSGIVMFALQMKRSQILSPFRNIRGWQLVGKDSPLLRVSIKNMQKILPKLIYDASFAALAYGTSFTELVWENKDASYFGIQGSRRKFTVIHKSVSVPNETISHIERPNGSYKGFVQKKSAGSWLNSGTTGIFVPVGSGLVLPYEDHFNNLWGTSFMESIYPYWIWFDVVLRAMIRYMERVSTPVTIVKAPSRQRARIPGTKKSMDALQLGLNIAATVAHSNAGVIPSDTDENGKPLWDINYLTSNESTQPFIAVLEEIAQLIFRAGLSADRAISQPTGGGGSYGLGSIHAQATAGHSEMVLLNWLMFLNNHFTPWYTTYNYGGGKEPFMLQTQGINQAERELFMKLFNIAGNSATFQDAIENIDWGKLGTLAGVPFKDIQNQMPPKQRPPQNQVAEPVVTKESLESQDSSLWKTADLVNKMF